jgi:hypothetical protein
MVTSCSLTGGRHEWLWPIAGSWTSAAISFGTGIQAEAADGQGRHPFLNPCIPPLEMPSTLTQAFTRSHAFISDQVMVEQDEEGERR